MSKFIALTIIKTTKSSKNLKFSSNVEFLNQNQPRTPKKFQSSINFQKNIRQTVAKY